MWQVSVIELFPKFYFIMPTRYTDTLFQLVHSLEKSEKRAFKLYIKRNSAKEDLKIIQLLPWGITWDSVLMN